MMWSLGRDMIAGPVECDPEVSFTRPQDECSLPHLLVLGEVPLALPRLGRREVRAAQHVPVVSKGKVIPVLN
jgi:hypothetical protein